MEPIASIDMATPTSLGTVHQWEVYNFHISSTFFFIVEAVEECECKGLYNPKFAPLHADGTAGGTAKKIWHDLRTKGVPSWLEVDPSIVKCTCCSDFVSWKRQHGDEAKKLQFAADQPCYYEVCDKTVCVDGVIYQKTI